MSTSDTQSRQLAKILASITILSPTAFSLAGQTFESGAALARSTVPEPSPPQNPLVSRLQQALYLYTYIHSYDGALRVPSAGLEPADDVTEMLSRSNASRERWDTGWLIAQVAQSGQVVVHKGGATRSLWPGEFISLDGPGTPPRIGATINIYIPRESRTMQPSFYFAFGETVSEPQELYEAVRFYWNLDVQGVAELLRSVTAALNRFRTPFRLKCCSHRPQYYRLDSAVLYVNRRHYHAVAELLVDVYRALRPHLRPSTPIFTRRLAAGLAFAEEPGTGESFGMFCCRVVAEAIWSAYLQGTQDVQARVEAIRRQFAGNEIELDRPYLRSGSVDTYEFPTYESQP